MTVPSTNLCLVVALSAAAVSASSCNRDDIAPPVQAPAAATPTPPPPSPPEAKADPGEPAADGAATDPAIVGAGKWSEHRLYRFRIERVAACGAPSRPLGPAQHPAVGGSGQFRGETSWVGAFLSIEAKQPALFVSPRDLEMRRGGVILNARHINQPLLPGCQPLLPARQMRAGESLGGFALFEVPRSFRTTTDDPIVLSYQPTRWGGARRVEVPIPECLDACAGSPAAKPARVAGRNVSKKL